MPSSYCKARTAASQAFRLVPLLSDPSEVFILDISQPATPVTANKGRTNSQVSDLVGNMPIGMPLFHTKVLGFKSQLNFQFLFPANVHKT